MFPDTGSANVPKPLPQTPSVPSTAGDHCVLHTYVPAAPTFLLARQFFHCRRRRCAACSYELCTCSMASL